MSSYQYCPSLIREFKKLDHASLSINSINNTLNCNDIIFISEHLSKENYECLSYCKNWSKIHNYKFTWFSYKIVKIRKAENLPIIKIIVKETLLKLESEQNTLNNVTDDSAMIVE